ncbi:MAG: hypothetical protein IPK16_10900 [Anaerolineales bacterium]|nr:hypothetical protein [Anaerolineales bacterium]
MSIYLCATNPALQSNLSQTVHDRQVLVLCADSAPASVGLPPMPGVEMVMISLAAAPARVDNATIVIAVDAAALEPAAQQALAGVLGSWSERAHALYFAPEAIRLAGQAAASTSAGCLPATIVLPSLAEAPDAETLTGEHHGIERLIALDGDVTAIYERSSQMLGVAGAGSVLVMTFAGGIDQPETADVDVLTHGMSKYL